MRTKPIFFKKHYVEIADAICRIEDAIHQKGCHLSFHNEVMEIIVAHLAFPFVMDNPEFDSWRFHAAARKHALDSGELRARAEASCARRGKPERGVTAPVTRRKPAQKRSAK